MSDPLLVEAFPEAVTAGVRLAATGRTIALAESCTGGLLAAVLTAVPGSSRYVLGGVVAYANELKTQLLGVPAPLIAQLGAVSAEVAEAMAAGIRARTGADIGIAITGVAGPGAESEAKPAGLVFVGRADEHGVRGGRIEGDLGREGNRAAAVRAALRLLLEDA